MADSVQIRRCSWFEVLVRAICCGVLLVPIQTETHSQSPAGAVKSLGETPDQKEVRQLAPGSGIEQKLAGGESHYYRITLEAKQYVHVRVSCLGVDVVLTLFAPDGKKAEEVDTPISTEGLKSVLHISESAGDYLLEVRARQKNAPVGRCGIDILRPLPATAQNMSLIITARPLPQAVLTRGRSRVLRAQLSGPPVRAGRDSPPTPPTPGVGE